MNHLIQKACELVNGQTALARELTRRTGIVVTQQRVRNWIYRGDEVPADFMASIEEITNGEVSRKDFRPNDFQVVWPELAKTRKKAALTQ
jgi:DNA-binding transcriptional regulator YdaS (Cro superfamily)